MKIHTARLPSVVRSASFASPIPPTPAKIGVVVLNYNCAQETAACIESLRGAPCGEMRIFVVDNASSDGSAEILPPRLREGEVWVPLESNTGYPGGNNAAIREALKWGAGYVLVINPDRRVEKGFMQHLVRALEAQPWGGAACPKILDPETGRVQSVGGAFSAWTGRATRRFIGREDGTPGTETWTPVDFPPGACVLFKRAFLEDVGLFNEGYFLYYEDTEIGMRAAREGWKILVIPQSRAFHGDTTGSRYGNPTVAYLGTRNQAWVVRQYGKSWHRAVFFVLCLTLRWPMRFGGRLLRGKLKAAWAIARGSFAGTFSRGWNSWAHLALPVRGPGYARPRFTDEELGVQSR
jgi:N-acetylglucosaminyl-diphospho-decaprenol L-rhamnosyltransferase